MELFGDLPCHVELKKNPISPFFPFNDSHKNNIHENMNLGIRILNCLIDFVNKCDPLKNTVDPIPYLLSDNKIVKFVSPYESW